jgi:NAD(P)-dependent dehydrogenase (short-subunit alcohol dehydrogenase family)
MADIKKIMAELMESDFTPTIHKSAYPGIAPSRPELSQAGRSILITGGGTSIGKSIAEHFILADAAHVIIVGRRQGVLDTAVSELKAIAKREGKSAKVLAIQADVSKKDTIRELFDTLASKGLALDVLVLNAAMFSGFETILDLGSDKVWEPMETNVRGPMYMTEAFMKQNEDKQKVSVPYEIPV